MTPEIVRIRLTGVRPLLMHSSRLADPLDPVTKSLAQITGKRMKTTADHEKIGEIEFFGGLWLDDGYPCIPSEALEATCFEAARTRRRGMQATAGLSIDGAARLQYAGPKDLDELWADKAFRIRVPVRVGTAKTMRTRPRFPEWSVEFTASFLPSLLDRNEVLEFFRIAGALKGLGDWRPKHGKFVAETIE